MWMAIGEDGVSETFDVWVADFADTQVTLPVDDDLTVQLETALARSQRRVTGFQLRFP
jgi:hypothetical protein